MNEEIEIIHIGEVEDIDVSSVESFVHDEKEYAIANVIIYD